MLSGNQHSKTAGPDGGVLLEYFNLIEKLARFDRECIPERVVHARGTGAHGVFVSSTDFSPYTKASFFAARPIRVVPPRSSILTRANAISSATTFQCFSSVTR
jgi:catalase